MIKPILYVVALLAIGTGAYFTLQHKELFEVLQADRIKTIEDKNTTSAFADGKEKELRDEQEVLRQAQDQQVLLTESIRALQSAGTALERDVAELDATLSAQKEEFDILERAMKEVGEILAGLGEDINFDNLPDKIAQVEEDKKQKIAKLDELQTLAAAADALLTKNKAELDRLVQRKVARDSRIGRNSMESVITAVNQDWGFLVIGAGSNSGFTPQTSLIVQRDGRMIGRVRPSSIEPTQTIAEIDFTSLGTGVRIQPGDRVILEKPISN
jgi:uncharacterized protein